MVRKSCSICTRCKFIGTSISATTSAPYSTRRPCFISRISMAKTSAAFFSSSFVMKSGAGSFCSTHHHFTTCARRPNSSTLNERRTQTTLRSECPSRKSPRAAEPNRITHSRFADANSFSLLTSSTSFVSVESISRPFLSFQPGYQPPEAPPPPLLPPPNPPNPPPPPPKPPPPQSPPPELLCELPNSVPSTNQSKPLPPDPPPRDDKLAITIKNRINPNKNQIPGIPPLSSRLRILPAGC